MLWLEQIFLIISSLVALLLQNGRTYGWPDCSPSFNLHRPWQCIVSNCGVESFFRDRSHQRCVLLLFMDVGSGWVMFVFDLVSRVVSAIVVVFFFLRLFDQFLQKWSTCKVIVSYILWKLSCSLSVGSFQKCKIAKCARVPKCKIVKCARVK